MAFPTTTSGWTAYVRNWIGADEYSDAQIGNFLDLAHVRLNTDLMSYPMEKLFHHTILEPDHEQPIDLTAVIPDFGKIRLVSVQGVGPLDVAALNEYVTKEQNYVLSDYIPEMYNIDANKLYIWPWPGTDAVVDIHYYEKVPVLSETVNSNTFTLHHPDLLLYAASLEAAPYMVEDERIAVWENKYTMGVMTANANVTKIKMGSTPLLRKISGFS
ncbi:MAG: hypothetical protein EHM23_31450 [Acidobacteria bacterium]|nr:MAG: hypothetical protein EHM23_31450 [Acidobacteriota bacterium]